ncbi:MAG: ABC transporter substrate-binding protein, partial [Lacipirellulaceae bacterium]
MIRSILFPKDTLKPCIASIWFVATAIGLAVASGTAQGQTLYAALSTELKILDPVYTTASITRNHGFMIYDQLFGIDLDGQPRPQMVETHTVRDDGLVHSFTLRDGLRFHDGQPVRATDVIASIRRWGERDSTGKLLLRVTEKLEAVAPNAFRIKLSEPFGMLRFALGKPSGS